MHFFVSQLSEADPFPNVVCQVCWKTTEEFHELYEKSKEVQEKFLNSLVKVEADPIDVVSPHDNEECNSDSAEILPIKVEVSSGE